MSDKKRKGIRVMIDWYQNNEQTVLSDEDYNFLYNLDRDYITFYGKHVQTRLNKIRLQYIHSWYPVE